MSPFTIAAILALSGLTGLGLERWSLFRARRRIILRVAVTGTRGKSAVTRLLAGVVRETGLPVAAKTTGSRPVFIRSDGTESVLPRTGRPSILEQKAVLRAAGRLGARALVAEMMSIRPENLRAEARLILRPNIVVITNARLDHRPEMGGTKDRVALSLSAAIAPGSTVFVLEEENRPVYAEAARRAGAKLVIVPAGGAAEGKVFGAGRFGDFPENARFVEAVAAHLGIAPDKAAAAAAGTAPDFGALRTWRLPAENDAPASFAVNAFAANEPESTAAALSRLAASGRVYPPRRIAILNFRADREDRTRQWLSAARTGYFAGFAGLVAAGDHAAAIGRRLRRLAGPERAVISVIERTPERIMCQARALAGGAAVFIGMVNIAGPG